MLRSFIRLGQPRAVMQAASPAHDRATLPRDNDSRVSDARANTRMTAAQVASRADRRAFLSNCLRGTFGRREHIERPFLIATYSHIGVDVCEEGRNEGPSPRKEDARVLSV